MDATTYTKSQFINWLVGGQDMPTSPGSVYLALHNGDPGDSGENNELSVSNYTRVEITVSEWNITTGAFENSGIVEFPTADADWGDVSYVSIWDGPNDTDNSLGSSPTETTITINKDDTAVFRSGRLSGDFN
jgi:hypothetical protein